MILLKTLKDKSFEFLGSHSMRKHLLIESLQVIFLDTGCDLGLFKKSDGSRPDIVNTSNGAGEIYPLF